MFTKSYTVLAVRLALLIALITGISPLTRVYACSPTLYVKWNANGKNNGSTWANAYTNLQAALATACSGSEIWVATGTYKPTTGTDRTISFVLKNGVALYGGFAGDETARTQRNPDTSVTALSGDIGLQDDNTDNSYHVVIGSNTDRSAIVDGFTITAGNADIFSQIVEGRTIENSGGGIYSYHGNPRLTNVIFKNNNAIYGGGMYNGGEYDFPYGSNPSLINVIFDGNSADRGGGMYNENYSSPVLTDVTFKNNTGGGMENFHNCNPILKNTTFEHNVINGGMINLESSSPILEKVAFIGNSALDGGGMRNLYLSNPSLKDVIFSGNSVTERGGGMFNGYTSIPTLLNVTFSNNNSDKYGGGIANLSSNSFLTNVTFYHNSAEQGGGMMNSDSYSMLTNVTFYDNSTVFWRGGAAIYNSGHLEVENSIFWNNYGEDISKSEGGTQNITYSITPSDYTGNGNLHVDDPRLGELQNNGGFSQTVALLPGSPAIDAGDDANCPDTDQRGMSRPRGNHCDMGAYEAEGTPISVMIGSASLGTVAVPRSAELNYPGRNDGPVKIGSTNGQPIIVWERVAYTSNGTSTWTNFHKILGIPSNQLSSAYYFPWYNNVEMDTQMRFGNMGTRLTTVTVTVGGVVQGTYDLYPNQSVRVSYPNVNDGPVKIESSNGEPIIASMRFVNIQSTDPLLVPGFSEMIGLPANQLASAYYFPWYNNVEMDMQMRFGNVGSALTKIAVTVGGLLQGTYDLYPNQSIRVSYPNVNNGPVRVESSNEVPIIASMRFAYIQSTDPLVVPFFSEMVGLPRQNLSTKYWFPFYDNVTYNMQLRVGNVGNSYTEVRLKLGTEYGIYTLAPDEAIRLTYTGLNTGPVMVQSSNGVPVVAALRFVDIRSLDPLAVPYFFQMMGLPNEQLSSSYVFPWYNNDEFDTKLLIVVP